MHKRTILICLVLTIVLALLVPSIGVMAKTSEITDADKFEAAGIKAGDPCTVYYTDDGEIDRIVKGVPKGVTVDIKSTPVDELSVIPITKSATSISCNLWWDGSYLTSNPHYKGPARTCSSIYYDVYVTYSGGHQIFWGMYNVSGNYSTGVYNGPYTGWTHVTGTVYAWSTLWQAHIGNYWWSSPVVSLTGQADY